MRKGSEGHYTLQIKSTRISLGKLFNYLVAQFRHVENENNCSNVIELM